jgi:imidazolonepropionase-like amidohydrolase
VEELLVQSGMGITPTLVLPGFAAIVAEAPDLFATPQFRTFYGPSAASVLPRSMPMSVDGAAAVASANGDLLRRLVQRDALVVTGTDAPFVPYAAGLHAELRLYARAGLKAAQILHAATWKSAIAARVEHDLGSIEIGKIADLVVIDGDPLATIADADNVVMTIKGGRAFTLEDLGVIALDDLEAQATEAVTESEAASP